MFLFHVTTCDVTRINQKCTLNSLQAIEIPQTTVVGGGGGEEEKEKEKSKAPTCMLLTNKADRLTKA